MLALIQRVTEAKVVVGDTLIGSIGPGLLALVAMEPADAETQITRMAARLLGYRVFPDEFTLAADTRSGMRPSFTTASAPAEAELGFNRLVAQCRAIHAPGVETGQFGTHMVVSLVNDGPVTFLLHT
jgi:D-tyrosyl-tRNA(Tyr) deacylase